MPKRRNTRKPTRSVKPKPKITALFPPHPRLIAAVAEKIAQRAARANLDDANPDAELLEQHSIVGRVFDEPPTITTDEWRRALLRVGSLQPTTLPGLRAKIEIALQAAGLEPEPGDEIDQLDRVVIWLTLADIQDLLADKED